jgi:mono/diheme cytochrome c family protein
MNLDRRMIVPLALLAACVASGCHSFPYLVGLKTVPVEDAAPLVSRVDPTSAPASQLEAGRRIYVGQCAHCHKPMPISEFTSDDWTGKIIPQMSKKAKLTPDETKSLAAYIVAVKRM